MTTKHSSAGKTQSGGLERKIPFAERPTCSVNEAVQVSGLGRTTIYSLMKDGRIESTKLGGRRLIKVPSMLKLLGAI